MGWEIARRSRAVLLRQPALVVDGLPRSYEVVVRGRLKYRVGKIVYLAFSADESIVEFAFPKEWRDVLVNSEPETFMFPSKADMRFNWVRARMAALDPSEMRELVLDAWRMVMPKRVARSFDTSQCSAHVERSS
jgi:hypothetical protein